MVWPLQAILAGMHLCDSINRNALFNFADAMTNFTRHSKLIAMLAVTAICCSLAHDCQAETRLRNICRLKGQEENVLRGLGLVVGLNGTGEAGDRSTMAAIARAMELLGSPVGNKGLLDNTAIDELKKIKNASLVIVTATVPATGARRGEKLDCTVSHSTAKAC